MVAICVTHPVRPPTSQVRAFPYLCLLKIPRVTAFFFSLCVRFSFSVIFPTGHRCCVCVCICVRATWKSYRTNKKKKKKNLPLIWLIWPAGVDATWALQLQLQLKCWSQSMLSRAQTTIPEKNQNNSACYWASSMQIYWNIHGTFHLGKFFNESASE